MMINVTKTFLPDKERYKSYIDTIYTNGWVTNGGPLVQELEKKLAKYLGVKNIVLVANGTVALEIAYRVLGLKGFVVTTPFSFVATTSSLVTNGLLPIFADIDPKTFNISANKIEDSITQNTSAILGVHVYGNPCNVEEIETIAKNRNLKVIYDAAHAFGVKYKDKSILEYGDISTLSFHATKLFHTIEGGALIINDDDLVQKARYLINFGIENTESIPELGTNAKMNEFEAAMGLCILEDLPWIFEKRSEIAERYYAELDRLVHFQKKEPYAFQNNSYFPVLFDSESQLKKVEAALHQESIYPRRYFYPSLDTLNYIEPKQFCIHARDISKRVLCLPLFPELSEADQMHICAIIKTALQ